MYTKLEKIYIWLSLYNKISLRKMYNLISHFDPQDLFDNIVSHKAKCLQFVDEDCYNALLANKDNLDTYIQNVTDLGIQILTYVSKNYPQSLKEIKEAPLALYAQGDISLLNGDHIIAIVGTRRCTKYGKEVTEKFSKQLASNGVIIVSGLADGVDSIAHSACLEVGGKTIAILGSGLNEIYPAANTNLAKQIINKGGLIISEYKPNEKPQTYYFPYRNRLIAAISQGVLISEATEKSGSMHTKEYAVEYGKNLYVVPGRINDIYSAGCNQIIKNCQSAMVLSPDEILNDLNIIYSPKHDIGYQASVEQQVILNILDKGEAHIDELISSSGFDIKTLNPLLTKMELMGMIKKLPGNVYSK